MVDTQNYLVVLLTSNRHRQINALTCGFTFLRYPIGYISRHYKTTTDNHLAIYGL